MPVERLKDFLDSNGVKYITIRHSPAVTAQEIAASAHIKGRELAKTVIVKIDSKLAMAVIPAQRMLDLEKLSEAAGGAKVEIAVEKEFIEAFPGCELGAMPPFGNIYGIDVFVALELTEDEEIAFNAGSHSELVRLSYADFESLAKPKVAPLSRLE
ncbi:MAG: YbaK/EbsC family protein [Candidatus Fermentibacteraceae bacterium]|nr:YbaK/EbsC family protein [Candidatus Fermentibacteraceae bacterium]